MRCRILIPCLGRRILGKLSERMFVAVRRLVALVEVHMLPALLDHIAQRLLLGLWLQPKLDYPYHQQQQRNEPASLSL